MSAREFSDHRDVHDPLTCELCHAEGVGAELAALRAENERLKVEYDEATQALATELADERTLTNRLRQAAKAILARHYGHCPMGSWVSPGHDVIRAEWDALDAAVALDEEVNDGR